MLNLSIIFRPCKKSEYFWTRVYTNDDWHLAYMFPLIFVDVCLVGVFPYSVSTWRYPCVRVCVPFTLAFPSRENKIEQGVTRLSTWPRRRGIRTDVWVCMHCWVVIWVAGYFNFPLYCTVYGCVIGRIHYGLKVLFCFRHFTPSHYHHNAWLLTGVEHM